MGVLFVLVDWFWFKINPFATSVVDDAFVDQMEAYEATHPGAFGSRQIRAERAKLQRAKDLSNHALVRPNVYNDEDPGHTTARRFESMDKKQNIRMDATSHESEDPGELEM